MARITELETNLQADQHGSYHARLIKQLAVRQAELARQLRQPVTPERYRELSALHTACLAARNIVDTLWRRYRMG
ncbi:EscE/YscE/SsaE family type III secretion system needle protein co-chaperone [Chitinimonas arctica]|uniref:EscE/YscE/SsaE family type III secretion system needle protein co-chaperone n=1 Tax=Chitinimonas arctica TaxID=2594795 RepID=A0A516SA76_9NEIS|nr:EscE/YscE/SsaE family type III secretion system needle protein co-chaperone [Chitinimonas arctica]QDQ25054.1 EscE/YscE/SsaE family type III secretion system needle protein co-chaperone [Chitinimonas arctica]